MSSTVLRYELLMLYRDGTAWALAIALLVTTGLGVSSGLLRARLEETPESRRNAFHRHVERTIRSHRGSDAGELLYYLRFPTLNRATEWSRFASGQRDTNATTISVSMLTLEGQLHRTAAVNPTLAALGGFDLASVFVFLVPLLLIGICYDVRSRAAEDGSAQLIASMPARPSRVLTLRLLARLFVAGMLTAAVFLTGCLALSLPFDKAFWQTAGVLAVYFAFWAAVIATVAMRDLTTRVHLVSLLSLWLLWTLILPAIASSAVTTLVPAPQAFHAMAAQREGYHTMWDKPKSVTMERFYKRYPEWRSIAIPEDKFTWAWYYAMQQMGDDDAAPASAALRQTLRKRLDWSWRCAFLMPPVLAQLSFQRIARTDLKAHLSYLEAVRSFHEELKRFWYPLLFRAAPVSAVDWNALPLLVHEVQP